ncbi:MAG: ABC-type Fe3+-siderophore transport system,permease component [Chthonomonadaceae bacterium]|nr:ABC-type Fe3+-siderophore transport system,permease component [Chthonomonadaceae bacterium]
MTPSTSPPKAPSSVSNPAPLEDHASTSGRPGSPVPVLVLLTLALLGAMLVDIWMGEASVARLVTPGSVLRVLLSHTPVISAHIAPPDSSIDGIVWSIRLPRVLGGALIGMLLALAGVAFQSLLLNPLADPYFVGVSSGAGLGAAIVTLLGGAGWLAGFAPTLAAFVAGLAAVAIVYALARVNGRVPVQTFLLAGIVVGTALYSLTKLTVSLAFRAGDAYKASAILTQLLGSLNGLSWRDVWLLIPFGVLGGVVLGASWRELNMMAFGEESAAHLGVDTEQFKRKVLVAGTLVTAAAVAVGGIIAFVGMIVPQIARRLIGPDHRRLLPTAMLLGGIVLVGSDWLSRVYLQGLDIGVITSLIGAPVFCWLLRRRMTLQES